MIVRFRCVAGTVGPKLRTQKMALFLKVIGQSGHT